MALLPIIEVADRWFANLNASVDSSVTTWVLKSSGATNLPSRTIVHCDTEKVLVTDITVDTPSAGLDSLTVERGYAGTTAASHAADAQVAHLNYKEFHNEVYNRLSVMEHFISGYLNRNGVCQDGGLVVQATGSPTMTVEITAGRAMAALQPVALRELATLTFSAPATNDIIHIVQIDQNGNIESKAGTENASPTAPTVDADAELLAEIYLRPGATSIKDTDDATNGYIDMSGVTYL